MKNKPYLLALNRMNHIGPRGVMKLLKKWPHLADMFALSETCLVKEGLPEKLAQQIARFNFADVEKDLLWEQGHYHHLLTWEDKVYPLLLKEIHDPPPVLYAIGDITCFQQPTVAMVGSRKPSISGSENAWRFAYDLAMESICIVSGLALGIDAKAHRGCLEAKGKTIAVMGTGIDRIYPKTHQKLAEQIRQTGLLLTEFPLGTPPRAGHFPRRNRIISGLSLATLVVEAATKSGSLITARLALEQNREVLAIPSSIHNHQARGCHHLLQQGAKLITSKDDVLAEVSLPQRPGLVEDILPCKTFETLISRFIGYEITTVDQIMERSGLDMMQVTCELAELELHGMIKAVPGGYMRCSV